MRLFLALLVSLAAGAAHAVAPEDCTRTTHVSHGGEADHVDLGEGRVMWRDWWSQEGTATDITVMDCAAGAALTARTAEENMGPRTPFDRTERVLAMIARHEAGARVFATLERIADDLTGVARDVTLTDWTEESCACAAFYSELKGDKQAFERKG